MAKKKKAKKNSAKKSKKRSAVRRVGKKVRRATTAARKKTKKKATKAKTKAVRAKPKAASKRPVRSTAPAAPAVPANEERVGIVTHYFNHLGVAIIQLESGVLREGDTVHIKGHTSDFRQQVGSMEVDHVHVSETRPGQSFGLKVKDHAREHDVVYRVKGM